MPFNRPPLPVASRRARSLLGALVVGGLLVLTPAAGFSIAAAPPDPPAETAPVTGSATEPTDTEPTDTEPAGDAPTGDEPAGDEPASGGEVDTDPQRVPGLVAIALLAVTLALHSLEHRRG